MLLAVGTIGLNLSIWMRHKAVAAARGDWTRENFVSALAAQGVSRPVTDAVFAELSTYCSANLVLRPDDHVDDLLRIDVEEMEYVVERLFQALCLPTPAQSDPGVIPPIETVAELAAYLQNRVDHFSRRPTAAL